MKYLLFQQEKYIAFLTLNRPNQRNALSVLLLKELLPIQQSMCAGLLRGKSGYLIIMMLNMFVLRLRVV